MGRGTPWSSPPARRAKATRWPRSSSPSSAHAPSDSPPRSPATRSSLPGQRIAVDGRPEPRPDSPYGAYLERTGVAGTIRADDLDLEPGPVEPAAVLETVRRNAAAALARVLPEPEAGLAAGILIGLRDRVDRELAADFTTAGVSHVVAISGWNIAIVAAAVAALGGSLGRRRRSVLTMLAIVAYVCFSGASPSVVRAAAMAGVVLLARESGRAGRAAAALGWAVVLLLLADPSLIADAGFQLSSLATAGLIAWATPVGERIGRFGGGRVPNWLAESLGVSLAAQAATLPVVLATFGRLALISPAANLAIVPVVPVAMAAGGVALGAGVLAELGAPEALAAILAFPGWVALTIMVAIARFAADVPYASATLDPPSNVVAALASVGAVAAVEWRRRRPRRPSRRPPSPATTSMPGRRPAEHARPTRWARSTRLALIALASSIVLTAAVVVERPSGHPTVTVLDVGQGDAILVEGSRGGRLLIDGGPDPDRLLVELDRLIPPWDRRLDAVVLSHPHEDHVAGLAMLLERYRVARTFEPGMLGPGPGYAAWAAELAGRPTPGALLAAGDRLSVDDIALEVLWPLPGSVPREPPDAGTGINNVSIVLLGSVAGRRFLLTGDVEQEVDPELLARLGHVDLLKIAHHGSKTASTDAFLDAVDPTVAVASAGTGNPYGHPSPATLSRIEARGARVFRTDRDGSVSVVFETTAITVRSSGGRPRPTPRPTRSGALGGKAAVAFVCAVPQQSAAADPAVWRGPRTRPPASIRVADPLLYHRLDDGARQDRSRPVWCARSNRRRGSSGTRAPSRKLPRSSPRGPRAAASRSTAAWRNRRPSCTTPTRRCRRTIPSGPLAMGTARHAGSRSAITRSSGLRSRTTRSPGCSTGAGSRRGSASRDPRTGSWPMRTSVPANGSSPSMSALPRGDGATRAGTATQRQRCVGGPANSRRSCARRPGSARRRSGGCAGRALPLSAAAARMSPAAPPSVALLWGDDDLATARAVDGIAAAHAAGSGIPLDRWEVRGDAGAATDLIGQVVERLSTPVMFGGGTMAVVNNVGPLLRRNDHREALFGAIGTLAPGNVICFVEATPSGTKVAPQKRLADAITAAGGIVREFRSPKAGGLTAFIEAEARERKVALGVGAAKELATRIGGFVQEGDAERRSQTRIAATELEKLGLYRGDRYVEVDDVRALVAEAIPNSVWALTDAVGERRVARASEMLDRLLDTTARAGDPQRPPPADPRAARGGRPDGGRRGTARDRAGDEDRQRVPHAQPRCPGTCLVGRGAAGRARRPARARCNGQGRPAVRRGPRSASPRVPPVGGRPGRPRRVTRLRRSRLPIAARSPRSTDRLRTGRRPRCSRRAGRRRTAPSR